MTRMPLLQKHLSSCTLLMRQSFRIIILVLLLFFGYRAIANAFGTQRVGVLSEFDYIPVLLITFLTIASFVIEWRNFRVEKRFTQLSVGFIGIVFICIVSGKLLQYHVIKNKETIFLVSNKAGANNVLTYDFKRGGWFVLTEYDLFGHDEYMGQYEKERDTIRIFSSNYRGSLRLPNTGMIIKDTMFWNDFDTMVLEKKASHYSNFQK